MTEVTRLPALSCMPLLLLLVVSVAHGSSCRNSNWWGSFDQKDGLSKCDGGSDYITGLYRSKRLIPDRLGFIEEAKCCPAPSPYTGDKTQVFYANWWASFDQNNRWNTCPAGFFLQGLYRTGTGDRLWDLEEGRCMKPASHPYVHGRCYDHDITLAFDRQGWVRCDNSYFLTGLYRGVCDELYCLEKMRCCKMEPAPSTVDSLASAKRKVMDNTMSDMAYLAHYLGYGWCSGCRAEFVGEDFRKNGDTWVADKTKPCSGEKWDSRLSMSYGDWKFSMEDVVYDQPVLEDLQPESIDSGSVVNNADFPVSHQFSRTQDVIRSVSHTTTDSWKNSHELGVSIGYSSSILTGGFSGGVSYKFNYETSSSSSDSSGAQQKKSFSLTELVDVPAHSAVNWTLILSKTRRTVSYSAKVRIHFSTELRGFLRWGGGYNGASTNYHIQHRGSGSRPTFNYRFGDSSKPFYEALKGESEMMSQPWMWADMKANNRDSQSVIDSLTKEGRYEFTLTGRFEDVQGKDVRVQWGGPPSGAAGNPRQGRELTRQSFPITSHGEIVAKASAADFGQFITRAPIFPTQLITPSPIERGDTWKSVPASGN
ncbi:uncharacterized protein LOC101845516 [Aplysia californica]|uniref:Uncharacterized protein LOC101845516 n=1 Tax=Aplysia californica TaxID=6500 RepID=A0ABM0K9L6_APLCA|nr:uncharacterized protein LOC101845516 [Aplysia californica]